MNMLNNRLKKTVQTDRQGRNSKKKLRNQKKEEWMIQQKKSKAK